MPHRPGTVSAQRELKHSLNNGLRFASLASASFFGLVLPVTTVSQPYGGRLV
jgi:hypothetical protein